MNNFTDLLQFDEKLIWVDEPLSKKEWSNLSLFLNRVGGKWSTTKQAFEMVRNPSLIIERIKEVGTRSFNKFSLYETPKAVTDFICEYCLNEFIPSEESIIRVLEPSCGGGSLILPVLAELKKRYPKYTIKLDAYDIDPINVMLCKELGFDIERADFLKVEPDPKYDLVVLNPPFQGKAYLKHIKHAQRFMKQNKRSCLIAVAPTRHCDPVAAIKGEGCKEVEWLTESAFKVHNDFLAESFEVDAFKGAKIETSVFMLKDESYSWSDNYGHKQFVLDHFILGLISENWGMHSDIISFAHEVKNSKDTGLYKELFNKIALVLVKVANLYPCLELYTHNNPKLKNQIIRTFSTHGIDLSFLENANAIELSIEDNGQFSMAI